MPTLHPQRNNEHVNQHLVAGYADAVFTADDKLWQNEPGSHRHVHKQARDLGWQVEYPHSRWKTEVPHGYVWHCSLSIPNDEGQLTDAQWAEAAHSLVEQLGFSGADGKAPCRWVAVRHGPSSAGNDHIHVAVNLVREDGTKASIWHDYRKAGAACAAVEKKFGLRPVPGRIVGRSVPEPTRKDREISAARGEPEPLRVHLERTVRACAAAARSESHFVALAQSRGLLIRPRYSDGVTVTGYAVADPGRRHAFNRQAGVRGPIWFGGGKLASDLSLPSLRRRWAPPGIRGRAEALAAWSAVNSMRTQPGSKNSARLLTIGDDPVAAADLLAAAAVGCEPDAPGPLARAARLMAKAAVLGPAVRRHPETMAVVSDMATAFLSISTIQPGSQCTALALMTEVSALVDACAAKAKASRGCEVQQARTLVHVSLDALRRVASRQARTSLSAAGIDHKEEPMTDLTHEEDFLGHVATAGVFSARLIRTAMGQPPGEGAGIQALKAAGYREETPFDEHLRRELGEPRWAKYAADPARVVCAALVTEGAAQGHDMYSLISKAAERRAWEDDERSPAKSIARVLAYRIKRELENPASRRVSAFPPSAHLTSSGDITAGVSPVRHGAAPTASTPWDDHLRRLLGDQKWQQYAGDERRRDVAKTLIKAHANGYDVAALLTEAVHSREWEDDPRSPARRVGSVLHYRIQVAISRAAGGDLPTRVAATVANATAPAGRLGGSGPSAEDASVRHPGRNTRSAPGRDQE